MDTAAAHRQHTLDIPPAPAPIARTPLGHEATWRDAFRFWAATIAVVVLVFAAIFGGTYWLNGGTHATPIVAAAIATAPLPPVSAAARTLQARLEDWRAGYETAVENGCKLQPLMTAPVSRLP
jgi:hypothetical protein